jgi:hypothetical protein
VLEPALIPDHALVVPCHQPAHPHEAFAHLGDTFSSTHACPISWSTASRPISLTITTQMSRRGPSAEPRCPWLIVNALEGNAFRFDASDLMPPAIGQGVFWESMMRYLEDGPDSLDGILADLDAAWPHDG